MSIFAVVLLLLIGWITWRIYSNYHNLPCPAWLSWMIELDNPFAKAHKANEIIEALPLRKGIKILDIGCGPGRVLLPLAKKISDRNGHVTGLDIQTGMLEKVMEKAKGLDITNVDFVHGNIDETPINQSYDIILMICVLGEIPQKRRELVMQKAANHLHPEGIISITETIFDPHFQSRKYVSEILGRVGFVETKFMGNRLAYTAHFRKGSSNS